MSHSTRNITESSECKPTHKFKCKTHLAILSLPANEPTYQPTEVATSVSVSLRKWFNIPYKNIFNKK